MLQSQLKSFVEKLKENYNEILSEENIRFKNVLKKYPELDTKKKSPVTYGNNPIKFTGDQDPRKKGKKYKTGSYIDETDHEEGKYTTTNKRYIIFVFKTGIIIGFNKFLIYFIYFIQTFLSISLKW